MRYQKGQYLNAMNPASADRNEQNIATVRGDGVRGHLQADCRPAGAAHRLQLPRGRHGGARPARGPHQIRLARGRASARRGRARVKVGQRVKGGASVLAAMPEGETA